MKEADRNFELILTHRKKMSAVCFDINNFCKSIKWDAPPFHPPKYEVERLLSASLDGFMRREISIFGSLTILERANKMDEAFILARTLFEVSADAARFGIDFMENPIQTVERISYAWHTNKHHILKESPNATDEELKLVQSKIQKVSGLNKEENKRIVDKMHFSGKNLRERAKGTHTEKYYKGIYARLSRYTHGMTFDSEIAFAKEYSAEFSYKQRICEELLALSYCATMVLEHVEAYTPLLGLHYDQKTWQALFDRATEMADTIKAEHNTESGSAADKVML